MADAAADKLSQERAEPAAQALKAKQQVEEATALKKELAQAKEQAQREAAELQSKRAVELQEATRQVEEARRLKKELKKAKRAA